MGARQRGTPHNGARATGFAAAATGQSIHQDLITHNETQQRSRAAGSVILQIFEGRLQGMPG
jgi:hypothetical protein